MRRNGPVVAVALLLVIAGCLGLGPGSSSTDGATPTAEPTSTDAPPSTVTPTATESQSSGNVSAEYVIEPGGVPDALDSVTVTMEFVFVEKSDDFSRNACWRDTYYGPYKPTPTPIGTPDGDCYVQQQISLDLTEIDGTRTLEGTAPGRFDAGHALIVTNVTATHRNGTSITTIKGAGGHRAKVVRGSADGQYHLELMIEAVDDRRYDYRLVSQASDTDGEIAGGQ